MTTYNKAYPLLPQLAFKKTSIDMDSVIAYIKRLTASIEVKRATYLIFRNESANGAKGIQNNYIGLQSDGDKFPNEYSVHFTGYCVKNENNTGKARGFLCFDKWQASVDILSDEISTRGLFVGGKIQSPYVPFQEVVEANFCKAYNCMWVYGDNKYKPTAIEIKDFNSMYSQAKKLFL